MGRKRKDSLSIDKQKIAERVVKFYKDVTIDRSDDLDRRLQRYAKYRMWTEGRDWIGSESSDAAIPDMMTHSLKVQDTLHNAVMSIRPAVTAKSIKKEDLEKEEKVNNLIDYQVFVEGKGENMIEEAAECFVNDPSLTIFIPWIREKKKSTDIRVFDPVPEDSEDAEIIYFRELIDQVFPQSLVRPMKNHWDWRVTDEDDIDVNFYERDDKRIEMVIDRMVTAFDGPKPMVKDYDDVLFPVRASNLQAPGPSNPGGAAFVILQDFPSIDEINKLAKSGFYDLVSDDELTRIRNATLDDSDLQKEKQKDDFQGTATANVRVPGRETGEGPGRMSSRTLTRLTCFDLYDIDGDGLDEDVIFWVIKETKTVLRARKLTEMYPSNPPRRPFAESSFLPVKGRKAGISLLEMMEGLHDLLKQNIDQMFDAGTVLNSPYGFYRPASGLKQEVIRMWPGELYPLSDPKNDVYFPSFNNTNQAFGINMVTILGQFQERLTNIGDLQFGRVPQGKASALRTVSGMQTILSQGEARPERILRRFFMCLTEIWAQIHELNQHFLPEKKKYRIMGFVQEKDDVYQEINDSKEIEGRFQFDFSANILNTSKQAMNAALNELMSAYLNPLALQMGLVDQEGAYRLLRDKGKAVGQDPDRYLSRQLQDFNRPRIMAEEAIASIMDGMIPNGIPAEPPIQHFQKLQEFAQSDKFGLLEGREPEVFRQYMLDVQRLVQEEIRRQQLVQAASQFQQGLNQSQPGQPVDQSNPLLQQNELLAEDLPTAGGGANV